MSALPGKDPALAAKITAAILEKVHVKGGTSVTSASAE